MPGFSDTGCACFILKAFFHFIFRFTFGSVRSFDSLQHGPEPMRSELSQRFTPSKRAPLKTRLRNHVGRQISTGTRLPDCGVCAELQFRAVRGRATRRCRNFMRIMATGASRVVVAWCASASQGRRELHMRSTVMTRSRSRSRNTTPANLQFEKRVGSPLSLMVVFLHLHGGSPVCVSCGYCCRVY